MVCRDNPPPPPPFFLCVMWPKVHFRVMSSTSKITKRDKQMYLIWTVPITHLRHAFIQCCASFPLLRWEYLYAMAAAIKNMDSAVTWPRYQTKKSEGSRVPDYLFPNTVLSISRRFFWCLPYLDCGQICHQKTFTLKDKLGMCYVCNDVNENELLSTTYPCDMS